MRYVIASGSESILAVAREMLSGLPGIEFRAGTVPDTWEGCDATVMWWPLAHDRYGGIPEPEVAQILHNNRGDDLPGIILATPSGPGRTSGVGSSEDEIELYACTSLGACISEFKRQFSDRWQKSQILVHLEASGLDREDINASLRGISKALKQADRGL